MTTRKKPRRTFTVLPANRARATALEVLPHWEHGKAVEHAREYIPELLDDTMGAIVESVKLGELQLRLTLDNHPGRRLRLLEVALEELGYQVHFSYNRSGDLHAIDGMEIRWMMQPTTTDRKE